jgi:hypothetical protein
MSLGCLEDGDVGIVLGEVCAYMRAVLEEVRWVETLRQ